MGQEFRQGTAGLADLCFHMMAEHCQKCLKWLVAGGSNSKMSPGLEWLMDRLSRDNCHGSHQHVISACVAWDFYSMTAGFWEAAFQEEMLQETKAKASRSSNLALNPQVTPATFYWLSVSLQWQKNVWGVCVGEILLKPILEKHTLYFAIFCSSSNLYPPAWEHPWSLMSELTHQYNGFCFPF